MNKSKTSYEIKALIDGEFVNLTISKDNIIKIHKEKIKSQELEIKELKYLISCLLYDVEKNEKCERLIFKCKKYINQVNIPIIIYFSKESVLHNCPTETLLHLNCSNGVPIEGIWKYYRIYDHTDEWSVSRDGGKSYYIEMPPLGIELYWEEVRNEN